MDKSIYQQQNDTQIRMRMVQVLEKGGPGSGKFARGEGKGGYPKKKEEKDPKTAKEFARRLVAAYKSRKTKRKS